MALRSGGLFCPLPDTTAASADKRAQNRISASHGVRCSLYVSAEPFDIEAGPSRLYKPSVRTGPDGAQELRAYVESDSPYVAVQLALEGVSSNSTPLAWQHTSPLYARMCMDGSAQPVRERIFDSHVSNPSFLDYSHRDNEGNLFNVPFCFKQRGLNEGGQPSLAVEESVIESYSSIAVEVGTLDRPAAPPLVATATSRTLGREGPAESHSSALGRETRSGPGRAHLGQSSRYLHARLSHFVGLDDLASKPADVHAVSARSNLLKTKALVRFTFYYKSRTRLRACGLLENGAGGPVYNAPAVPHPTAGPVQSQTRASGATAAASSERGQPLLQHVLTAWQTPQLVLRTIQSQNQNHNQNQNQHNSQNQNQNENRNSSQNQMARSQHQQPNRSADPRRRPGSCNRGPAQSAPEQGLQAAGPSTSTSASGAKPPLLAPSPSTLRAEDQAREAKRIKREAVNDGLQQVSGSAPRSPLAPTPRPAARVPRSQEASFQAARPATLPQPPIPLAGPSVPRAVVPSGASRSTAENGGSAIIDLTSKSDDEQRGEVPAREHTGGRQDDVHHGVKQEGIRQAAARVEHRDQDATTAHPAAVQQGDPAAVVQHKDQQAEGQHRGAARPKAAALAASDSFLSHVEVILGPAMAASVGEVLADFSLDISLEEIRTRFAWCDEGGKEVIWNALDERIMRFNRGVIMGLIEQRGDKGSE